MSDLAPLQDTTRDYVNFLLTHPGYKPLVSSTALYRALKTVDMGPAPPTTRQFTFRVLFRWTGPDGAIAENVFYGSSPTYTGSQSQVDFVAGAAHAAAIAANSIRNLVVVTWSLQSTICQDNSGTGNFSQHIDPQPGLNATGGVALPPNVAGVISWDVDQRYKGGHPRTYVPGMGEGNLTTPGGKNWTGGFTSQLKSVGKVFLDALVANLAAQLSGVAVGTLSRRANFQWKTPPDFWPYVDSKSHPRVDTQRRRLGKEITSG